jgi:hypothetical protein
VKYQIQTSRAKETAKSNADTLKAETLKSEIRGRRSQIKS